MEVLRTIVVVALEGSGVVASVGRFLAFLIAEFQLFIELGLTVREELKVLK